MNFKNKWFHVKQQSNKINLQTIRNEQQTITRQSALHTRLADKRGKF